VRKNLDGLYERARIEARSKGYIQEADDFASWLAAKHLDGKAQRQTVGQSFIDYLRATFGDTGTAIGRMKLGAIVGRRSIVNSRELVDKTQLGEDEMASAPPNKFENGRMTEEFYDKIKSAHVSQMERIFLWLKHGWDFTNAEIANCAGIKEDQIAQKIDNVHQRIKKTLVPNKGETVERKKLLPAEKIEG